MLEAECFVSKASALKSFEDLNGGEAHDGPGKTPAVPGLSIENENYGCGHPVAVIGKNPVFTPEWLGGNEMEE